MTAPATTAAAPAPSRAYDATDTSGPGAMHPTYRRLSDDWAKCRDLLGGTKALRRARELYLPRHPKELPEDYDRRLKMSTLFNAFTRTVGAMVGLVFQQPPQLGDDNAEPVTAHWENIDGKGTHGSVFLTRLFREGVAMGRVGILVDVPPAPQRADGQPLSKADEAVAGVRPYWRRYRAEDVRNWFTYDANGVQVLRLLVLREHSTEQKGAYGVEEVCEYRVLEHTGTSITWSRWREVKDGASAKLHFVAEGTITNQSEIPFVLLATGPGDDEWEATPPLNDLADTNLAHYQVASDRRHLMHLACVPVPVRVGYRPTGADESQPIGANILIDVPSDGDFKWAEVSGTAFEPTGQELDRLEKHMAALGLAFLQSDTRAAETAEAKRLDTAAQNATLASAATALQDAAERALEFHAKYLRVEPGSITVNTAFEATVMDPRMIEALSRLEVAGQLDLETLLRALELGGVLPDDVTVDDIMKRIMAGRALPDANAGGVAAGGTSRGEDGGTVESSSE